MKLEWMAWTLPSALFFIGIAIILVAMDLWWALAISTLYMIALMRYGHGAGLLIAKSAR
jgi:predicted small integral membrane protein